jgi:RNA polymerase sigma-70 factor (ECF subfamily)
MNSLEVSVQEFMKGNQDAFQDIYEHFLPKIYSFVFYKVHRKEVAEDICSEVFFKVVKKIHQFDVEKGTFSSWIYAIARNEVTDFFRAYSPSQEISDAFEIPSDENVSYHVSLSLELERVEKYLKTLTAKQREILTLRLWEDLSYAEIADITGMSEGALKMSVARSLSKIRKDLFILYFISLIFSL